MIAWQRLNGVSVPYWNQRTAISGLGVPAKPGMSAPMNG
jgi:hypothetical protein